jgi:hypothetical protein
LHQGAQAGGIEEVDATQVDHQGQSAAGAAIAHVGAELLIGIGIQLADEPEQQATVLPLAAPP